MTASLPATAPKNPQPLDGESAETAYQIPTFIERCMGDRLLAASLLEKFIARLPNSVRDIERSLADKHWPGAVSLVHALKGEAGNMAALGLHRAATELERSLRATRYAEAPAWLAELRSQANRCQQTAFLALSQISQWNGS